MGTVLLSAHFADRRTVPMSYPYLPGSFLAFAISLKKMLDIYYG